MIAHDRRFSGWWRAWWPTLVACGMLLAAVLLPPDGASLPICPSRLLTGIPCPGCGLTRSVTSLAHADFRRGWLYNPFGIGAIVVMGWYALKPVVGRARAAGVERSRPVRVLGWTVLALFLAHGIGRGVGVLPDHTRGVPSVRSRP
jgi:hypothetical protein